MLAGIAFDSSVKPFRAPQAPLAFPWPQKQIDATKIGPPSLTYPESDAELPLNLPRVREFGTSTQPQFNIQSD